MSQREHVSFMNVDLVITVIKVAHFYDVSAHKRLGGIV